MQRQCPTPPACRAAFIRCPPCPARPTGPSDSSQLCDATLFCSPNREGFCTERCLQAVSQARHGSRYSWPQHWRAQLRLMPWRPAAHPAAHHHPRPPRHHQSQCPPPLPPGKQPDGRQRGQLLVVNCARCTCHFPRATNPSSAPRHTPSFRGRPRRPPRPPPALAPRSAERRRHTVGRVVSGCQGSRRVLRINQQHCCESTSSTDRFA